MYIKSQYVHFTIPNCLAKSLGRKRLHLAKLLWRGWLSLWWFFPTTIWTVQVSSKIGSFSSQQNNSVRKLIQLLCPNFSVSSLRWWDANYETTTHIRGIPFHICPPPSDSRIILCTCILHVLANPEYHTSAFDGKSQPVRYLKIGRTRWSANIWRRSPERVMSSW